MENSRGFLGCLSLLVILSASALASPAGSPNLQNFTVVLPQGTTNHGDPELICTPTQWTDIASFFVGNYIAHALTVVILPGEDPVSYLTNALRSLLFPAFGAYRGLRAISVGYMSLRKLVKRGWPKGKPFKQLFQSETWEDNELQFARRSGALCMIVRSREWEPRDGDEIEGVLMLDAEKMPAKTKKKAREKDQEGKNGVTVHEEFADSSSQFAFGVEPPPPSDTEGLLAPSYEMHTIETTPDATVDGTDHMVSIMTYPAPWTYCREAGADAIGSRTVRYSPEDSLSKGYEIVMVPPSTPIRDLPKDPRDVATDRISASYSIVKGIVALVQAGFAVQTLYQSRGDQIRRYGYSAFGLTVAPYAIMSFVNLLGALSRPEYGAIYLVGSPTMIEERRRKGLDGYYEGTVGEVLPPDFDANYDYKNCGTPNGMKFIPGAVKFNSSGNTGPVRATYASSKSTKEHSSARVRSRVSESTAPGSLNSDESYLLVPSTPQFAYHMKRDPIARANETGYMADYLGRFYGNELQLPTFDEETEIWSIPFSRSPGAMTWLLPRCTHYLERSRSLSFLVSMTPLIPIGIISGFRTGDESKVSARAITMLWFSWGALMGWIIAEFGEKDTIGKKIKGKSRVGSVAGRVIWYLILGTPAILGWVVVGRMLVDYGTCIKLPGD